VGKDSPPGTFLVGLIPAEEKMSSFRVLVGRFEIVGTTGEADGHKPASKSQAVSFDVRDRVIGEEPVCRDPSFDAAWDFCTMRLAALAQRTLH
jgi:hypothetical protein